MGSKIKILLMVLAYALNFAHELQIHDHHSVSDPTSINQQSVKHFHDSKSICRQTDNESKDIPFTHCHIEHAYPYTRYVNIETSLSTIDISILIDDINSSYKFAKPRIIPIQHFHSCFYQNIISTSQGLRAPPTIS